jgi:putative ABC transport system permease protein
MIVAELRGLWSRKLRTILTVLAIVLGVSMISGTYILTDTINSSFAQIFKTATRNIDAVITGKKIVNARFSQAPTIPASLLPIVRATPGVAAADGEIAATASLFDKNSNPIGAAGGAPSLLFGIGDEKFNQLTLVSGHWPGPHQVVLDQSTMDRNHLRIGQTVQLAAAQPLQPFVIVGKTRFGNVGSIGGASLLQVDLATAQRLTDSVGRFNQIGVMKKSGLSQAQVVRLIKQHLPPKELAHLNVRTGEQQAASQAAAIGTALNFLTIALLAFGFIAVFVGAFIIFNTFSITVAQRAREFALLRTLGSTRTQILRTVVTEALLIGVAASLVGLGAGFGIAKGLNSLFMAFGADLPNSGYVVQVRTVIVAILTGTLVTVASGLVPAIRATRVPPIAALREGVELPKGRLSKFMPYIAGGVTVLAILVTVVGIFANISDAGQRLLLIGFGAALLFIGVAMLSPILIVPLASGIGWPIEKITAITGRLARDNTMRNPSRTAITAAALMIGLALVAFVTIFAAELKKTSDDAVNREVAGTFIIQNQVSNDNTIPLSITAAIARLPGVSVASATRRGSALITGIGTQRVDAIQPQTFGKVYRFQWVHGNEASLARLGSNGSLIDDGFASSHKLHIGSRIRLLSQTGKRDIFVVNGVFKSSAFLSAVLIPYATFGRDWSPPPVLDQVIVVNAAPHANQATVEKEITAVLKRFPLATVSSQAQFKQQQDQGVNSLLALVYVLLGLSIVVSLFGIVNTLVLSIYERTREIGMLRAIGTTRSQVRWIIRWESVITALIGALLGLVLGIVLAVLITIGLSSQGIEFALPVGQLFIWLVFAIFFGIVAAAFPARRAARLDVLRAISYE